ncbi:MAG: response regulator, partial [Proteobacteria bacterium]|nr:response regulator [Pseudomonadota bacterium]
DDLTKPVDLEIALARVHTQIRRKNAEEAVRRANDDLERQLHGSRGNAANSQHDLLADISHEIRTPLNGVVSVASLLAGTELQPAQREMVNIIEHSAATLEQLLTDLLDAAKADAGELGVRTESFALAEALECVVALWAAKAREKGVACTLQLHPEAHRNVLGDVVRLKQILNNLLSNAVKFTEAGSVTVSLERTGDRCRFTVADTGIGFGPAVKDRLFKRFEQADGSISERFGGTGLGLAISRELARLMGGELDCTSVEGDGAVFSLELPLPLASEEAANAAPADAEFRQGCTPRRTCRVLLAEDHPVNRKVVELMLQGSECDLTCVENGAEAFDLFRRSSFDVVLMDVQMPVMDGLTSIQMIRGWEAEQGRSATPILVLTAHSLPEHARASLAAGANGHLSKPINAPELLSTLAAWTGVSWPAAFNKVA